MTERLDKIKQHSENALSHAQAPVNKQNNTTSDIIPSSPEEYYDWQARYHITGPNKTSSATDPIPVTTPRDE